MQFADFPEEDCMSAPPACTKTLAGVKNPPHQAARGHQEAVTQLVWRNLSPSIITCSYLRSKLLLNHEPRSICGLSNFMDRTGFLLRISWLRILASNRKFCGAAIVAGEAQELLQQARDQIKAKREANAAPNSP